MNNCFLKDVAEVVISNVDKKSKANEKEISLCNFTDVYYNWAIYNNLAPNLMKATATLSEIDKYLLKKGFVAITKDSETKFDIGQSTYIADDIENVLLGYHCALIKPNANFLSGEYLNALFHSPFAAKYFEYNASGSGQRYTLSLDAINDFQLHLPSIDSQKKIVNILSLIDKKIRIGNEINDNLSQLLKTIYDYWFTQFDFPDENGNPYRLSGGKMVWNDILKRQIPFDWTVEPISSIIQEELNTITPDANTEYTHYSIPSFDANKFPVIELGKEIHSGKYRVIRDSILVSKLNPQFMRVWMTYNMLENEICSTEFVVMKAKSPSEKPYCYALLTSDVYAKYLLQISNSSTGSRKRAQPEEMLDLNFPTPPKSLRESFSAIAKSLTDLYKNNNIAIQQLYKLRDYLLPLLMNGQATIQE